MTLNGVKYTYETNAQGDVTGLVDSSGNEVVTYSYDTWGKLLSIGGTLASTVGAANPFRYRGYYYDTETGLYYLQSRYYNPELGRFISKDDPSYHDGQDAIGSNLYAYANNNPVMNVDTNGHASKFYWLSQILINVADMVASVYTYRISAGVVYVGSRYVCAAAYWYLARLVALQVDCSAADIFTISGNLICLSAAIITAVILITFYLTFLHFVLNTDIKNIEHDMYEVSISPWF
jgi:RHS repeat-associated protein